MNILLPGTGCRACIMAALWLASGVGAASAGGPVGPVGPVGPIGAEGGRAGAVPRPARPAASAERAGNRIEVTGNTASGTACGPEGASVNHVDVRRAQLEGHTVIVQGRNVNGIDTRDCAGTGNGAKGRSEVNSIRIR